MEDVGPLLVVGGRTTGLAMACELKRHGAPVRIIDKCPGIDPTCRATLLHSRTLEVFHDMGMVDEVLDAGVEVRALNHYADGRRFLRIEFGEVESPYPRGIALGQNVTEAILERHLGRLGLAVERRTELVGMQQEADRVRATLRHADGREEQLETPWLIGCDGAHSTTRQLNREVFQGPEDPHQYVLADVMLDAEFERDEVHGFLTEQGNLFFVPIPEERTLVLALEHHEPTTEAPTLEEIQAVVSERGPAGTRVRDPRWLAHFRVRYRLVSHYRHGRVFLAGDAAHIHSPVGGMGMNTGIQDAYNLAWKLALVARRRAATSLLDTYEKERRDVAENVLRLTRAATESLGEWDHLSQEERRQMERSMIVPEAERRRHAQQDEQLDLDYRKSPICIEHVRDGIDGGPHAGAQAPDAGPLEREGRVLRLFDLLRGTKHTLLVFPGSDPAWQSGGAAKLAEEVLASHGDLLDVCLIAPREATQADFPSGVTHVRDTENALARRYGVVGPACYLIRPDGYVGYREAPPCAVELREYLDRAF